MLLVPAQERDGLGVDVTEPELAPLPDPDRYTEEQWQVVDALFELDEVPRRLSGLLDEARAADAAARPVVGWIVAWTVLKS